MIVMESPYICEVTEFTLQTRLDMSSTQSIILNTRARLLERTTRGRDLQTAIISFVKLLRTSVRSGVTKLKGSNRQ